VVHHHLAGRDELRGLVGEVVAGDHGLHAGERLGLRGVDRDDARVWVRAAQHLADELARQVEVGAEARASGDLVDAVRSDRARADVALPVGPVRAVLGHWLSPSQGRGRVLHRADDLVVSRAPAKVPRQPEADLVLRRIRRALEQRLAGHQEARRADAALERCMLEELLLQRMELLALGQALDRLDAPAADLAAQHETGADQAAVERHAAGAAVAGGTAFLAAGEIQGVAQDVEEGFFGVAEELDRVTVHGGFDMVLGHQLVLARSSAIRAARRVSTAATSVRNSTVPRLSSLRRHARRARRGASGGGRAAPSRRVPMMACAASWTSSTRAAPAPSETRAAVIVPPLSSVKLTPAPTTAMSISVRGMKRR